MHTSIHIMSLVNLMSSSIQDIDCVTRYILRRSGRILELSKVRICVGPDRSSCPLSEETVIFASTGLPTPSSQGCRSVWLKSSWVSPSIDQRWGPRLERGSPLGRAHCQTLRHHFSGLCTKETESASLRQAWRPSLLFRFEGCHKPEASKPRQGGHFALYFI